MAAAPSTNCSVPSRAEALPATRPCGAIASAVVLGMVKPWQAMKQNSGTRIPGKPKSPVAAVPSSAAPASAATGSTTATTRRAP